MLLQFKSNITQTVLNQLLKTEGVKLLPVSRCSAVAKESLLEQRKIESDLTSRHQHHLQVVDHS
jgi:hypothetical protein